MSDIPSRVFDLTAELRRYFDSDILDEETDLHLLLCEIEAMRPPDPDDAPELTGEEIHRPNSKWRISGKEVSKEEGMAAFREQLKVTIPERYCTCGVILPDCWSFHSCSACMTAGVG